MKTGIKDIVGKQIVGVVAARHRSGDPRQQLFLIFSDGTSLEIYGEGFNCGGSLDKYDGLDSIRRSIRPGGEITDSYFVRVTPALLH